MVHYVLGTNLSPALQREALARYCHRYTREHVPGWAKQPRPDGSPYPVQFASDRDWLANTRFPVTKGGTLANRPGSCESRPTWPDGPPPPWGQSVPSHLKPWTPDATGGGA